MNLKLVKRYAVLCILFFLPVGFLLMLMPAKHNYEPLDIVHYDVPELVGFTSDDASPIQFEDHITVLAFLGKEPLNHSVEASNLKEMVYNKFKGFKKFQIVFVVVDNSETDVKELHKTLGAYDELKYWHYIYGDTAKIQTLFDALKSETTLNDNLATNHAFIIDKDRNQRGRIDDRDDNELKRKTEVYGLYSYNTIEVAELKNKMSADDLRVLFQEYREKRKGNFDSSTRRANELKGISNE